MHFKSIEIENYKSFWKNQEIKLEKGFNLFIGANNSGKTTALEVLDLNFNANEPHRSIQSIPQHGAITNGTSKFKAKISTDLFELRKFIGNQIYLPIPPSIQLNQETEKNSFFERLISHPQFDLHVEFGGGVDSVTFEWPEGFSMPSSRHRGEAVYAIDVQFDVSNEPKFSHPNNYAASSQMGGSYLAYIPYVYRFSSQRRPAGLCSNTGTSLLDREAINLPFCINHLQSNDAHGHKLLCKWVNQIFPSVQWVQAPPIINSSQIELRCLPLPPESRRDDLAVPLNRMGSGIGNVIAMLYVVLTARQPQVIAIDEPNSFLHPRALRELLQILATEAHQHQIILTAHSADVLTAVKPSLITLFDFDGATTSIKQIDAHNISSLRTELSELGIHMTDLHGRDRVLWVEGQTEELVMPELLRTFCPEIAAGTAVLRVEHTGTFEKKGVDPAEVAKVYARLSGSSALVPPMVTILLDGELRTIQECSTLESESKGTLRFLDRRMIENYLLIPEAITKTLSLLGEPVAIDDVTKKLEKLKADSNLDSSKIDGAKILRELFSEITESRYEFKKTRDVPELISYLIKSKSESITELGKFLRVVFGLEA